MGRAAAGAVVMNLAGELHAQTTGPTTGPAAALAHDPRMAMWRLLFFWGVILLLVFLVGAGVIIRFSKRFRTLILSDPSPPTSNEDVWAMHRFPEKFEFDDPDEPRAGS